MNLSAKLERRMIEAAELRVDTQDNTRTLRGYAAVFDSLSQPLFGFREVIRKGAFKKTVRESDIRALWNHDPNFVLGRKSARTLKLEEDDKGLMTRIFPPSTQWATDLMTSIERGDVSQMSFGFQVIKDRWGQAGADGLPVRELLEVRLLDVSPVTFPAYQQTEVHVRAVMDSMLSRIERGRVPREERQAMRQALQNVMQELDTEQDSHRHSEENQDQEPGLPHSDTRSQESNLCELEERRRAILERRRRLLELAIQ